MGRAFEGDAAAQAHDAGLGGAVGPRRGRADGGRRRGDVDDAAPPPLDHSGQAELDGAVGAVEVDVEHLLPQGVGVADDGLLGRDAGGVGQDVDLAEGLDGRIEERLDGLR